MQYIKCDYCKREVKVENNVILYVCKCGNTIELKGGEEK